MMIAKKSFVIRFGAFREILSSFLINENKVRVGSFFLCLTTRVGSLNHLVLPSLPLPMPLLLPVLPIKHGSLNQNGSGEPGNTLETPTGSGAVVILRC